MLTVKYDDLSAAFDFVSFAAPVEHRAYLSLDTGAIYWISEANPVDEEELPDDLDTSRFHTRMNSTWGTTSHSGLSRGSYRRGTGLSRSSFAAAALTHVSKIFLAAAGRLEKWYAFEAESIKRALRDWRKANEICLAEDGSQPA